MNVQCGSVRAPQRVLLSRASNAARLQGNAPATCGLVAGKPTCLGSLSYISIGSRGLHTAPQSSKACRRQQLVVSARARDPDAVDGADDDAAANQSPPTLFWRVFAALCYLVPWIDSISLGREIYRRFRNLLVLYLVPGPLAKVYFSSQFAPLIIFFVMFLSIVKNKNLHHFVRFNCMQAIMLDIVVMLFHIVRAYLPAELKWSAIAHFVDMFAWTCCMGTVVYAVFWTLRGYYADIPFVSESVYHQVALSEYA